MRKWTKRVGRVTGAAVALLTVLCGTALAFSPSIETARNQAAALFPQVAVACPTVLLSEGPLTDPSEYEAEAISPCEIRLGSGWPTWLRSQACILLIHEYGHLAGLQHSPDPNSFMYPIPSPDAYPACARISELEQRLWGLQDDTAWLSRVLREAQADLRQLRNQRPQTAAIRRDQRHARRSIVQDKHVLQRLHTRAQRVTGLLGP